MFAFCSLQPSNKTNNLMNNRMNDDEKKNNHRQATKKLRVDAIEYEIDS